MSHHTRPIPLAYTEVGRGRPLVLLHAFPLSSALFGPLLDAGIAGEHWQVITPDLRGFGDSPLGDDEPSLAAMAADVVALLDHLRIETAVVGGVSMGGYVTMELLRAAPERVDGVLLIDTKAGADTEQARTGRLAMAQAVHEQGRGVLDPMLDGLLGATSRAERADVVALVSGWLDAADPAAVAWAQRAMAARPDSHRTLAESGVPGAVIVGGEDTLSPLAEATTMAQELGTAPRVVPAAGHLAVLEQPGPAAAAVRAALADLASSAR